MQPVRRQCSIPLTTYRTSLGATGVVRRDGKTRSQWSPLPTYCRGEEGGVLPERDWSTAMKKRIVYLKPVKMGRAYYRNVYLKSEEWMNIRQKILAKAPDGLCEKCHCQKCTDVHHMDYTILALPSFETRTQLIALCRGCHDLIEKAKKFRLLPERHFRDQLMKITEEMVSTIQKEKRRNIMWSSDQCRLWDSCTFHGKRLICGVLKRQFPDHISLWIGITITANQLEKIRRITVKNSENKKSVKGLKNQLRKKDVKFWREFRERNGGKNRTRGFKLGVQAKFEKEKPCIPTE